MELWNSVNGWRKNIILRREENLEIEEDLQIEEEYQDEDDVVFIQTHEKVNSDLNGEVIKLEKGYVELRLITTAEMIADPSIVTTWWSNINKVSPIKSALPEI